MRYKAEEMEVEQRFEEDNTPKLEKTEPSALTAARTDSSGLEELQAGQNAYTEELDRIKTEREALNATFLNVLLP